MAQDLAVALLAVFAINLAPAFMPPTWTILTFFAVRSDLPVIPLAVGGAVAASLGRLTLALASRRWGRALLPARRRASLGTLGASIDAKARWAPALAVLVYSFGPIPSNQLFVAAGLMGLRLRPIVSAFFGGRFVSYMFWVGAAHVAASRLDDLFGRYWRDEAFVAMQLALVALLAAFALVDWSKILRIAAGAEPRSDRSAARK